MITLKAQLQALQTMLRHLTGRNKHYKWQTILEASTSIKEITDHWEATVFSLNWADKQDAYKIIDAGGRGPSYWRTLVGYPRLVELVSEIERIKKKLHGRQRTELRILINSAVAARELSRGKGKLSLYLRALLGERRSSFSFDCLQLNEDTLLTNALEIHQQLTEHYFEFYQPTELQNCGMHNMSYDWNRISTDKAEFLSQIAIHKIPADKAWIIDLIWQSMRMRTQMAYRFIIWKS